MLDDGLEALQVLEKGSIVSSVVAAPAITETQLLQLDKIMSLVGEAAEVARIEIDNPPSPIGPGQPGTWSRISGVVSRTRAAVVIYDKLGGPELPAEVENFMREANQLPIRPTVIVGRAETVLSALTSFAEGLDRA
jgi:hypothetical protein